MGELLKLYEEWCKKTKRNGAILIGGSIREFFKWVEEEKKLILIPIPDFSYGWDCKDSPTGKCDYRQEDGTYDEDSCRYCGEPDERK